MDISSTGSSSKKPAASSVLSAGSVAVVKKPSRDDQVQSSDESLGDAQVTSVVSESGQASDAVKALTRGLQGVADLFVTSQPSRKEPLRLEASDLAQKLSENLKNTSRDEPVDDKLKALAQTLSSIFGDEEVKAPGISTKDFILGVLSQVSKTSAANQPSSQQAVEDDVKVANKEASSASVEDVDSLVAKITASADKGGILNAIRAPNVALLS